MQFHEILLNVHGKCFRKNHEIDFTSLDFFKISGPHSVEIKQIYFFSLQTLQGMKLHVKMVHEGKGLRCDRPECAKRYFAHKLFLRQHIEKFHQGIKNQVCHTCGKAFYNIATLNKHIGKEHTLKKYDHFVSRNTKFLL